MIADEDAQVGRRVFVELAEGIRLRPVDGSELLKNHLGWC